MKHTIEAKITDSIVQLRNMRTWIKDPNQDEKAKANAEYWFFKVLKNMDEIAEECGLK